MNVGDRSQIERSFTESDVAAYVSLGGAPTNNDTVPEPMIAALFSYLLGMRLPGPGTNYLKQSLEFYSAAKIGDMLTANVEIIRIRPEKSLVYLTTLCVNECGEEINSGRALVRVNDVER
ncbi:MAG: phosphate acetyltransferase [Alphaproteobacteria bacterium]|nr:phosphate acetyltransferase [Alphaproteobacteria bacterium]